MKRFLVRFSLLVLGMVACSAGFGQKMIYGREHLIFADMPAHWAQMRHDQIPFIIKPDGKKVGQRTYLYVLGQDFAESPDLDGWSKGNTDFVVDQFPGLVVDTLDVKFDNFPAGDFVTGRYQVLHYRYRDRHEEVLLVVECKTTIVTCVLSAENAAEFKKYYDTWLQVGKSLQVNHGKVIIVE